MATLPSQEDLPLLRRAQAARRAVKRYNADPHLMLYWAVKPSKEIEIALDGKLPPGWRWEEEEQ